MQPLARHGVTERSAIKRFWCGCRRFLLGAGRRVGRAQPLARDPLKHF